MYIYSVDGLRAIEHCTVSVLIVHENGWEEPLTILELEDSGDRFYPDRKRLIRIKVKPPLSLAKE